MAERLPFSQLWVEEEAYLREAAAALPVDSVVVDLGTAQGGSAFLFAEGTRGRRCAIYSYDLAPSREARENLAGTGVHLVAEASAAGAARWEATCGGPVQLLFVDASHTLANVFADYHAWVGRLAPGGRVLFHDYDPPERGGVSHLGVRVFLDALLASRVLRDVEHVGRILAAHVDDPVHARIPAAACIEAWRALGERARAARERSWTGWRVLGARDRRGELLAFLLGIDAARFEPWLAAGSAPVLVAERPLSEAARRLLREESERALLLDDLTIGYLLLDALRERRDGLLARARDRRAFFRFEEYLEMLEHAHPGSGDDPFRMSDRGLDDLSRRCAHELLRLSFAERLATSITEVA